LRKGATGPALDPKKLAEKGLEYLKAVIFGGLPGGMPDWGRQGILSEKETELMARFLLEEPPTPPIPSYEEIRKTWKVLVPVGKRPAKPQHNRNWQNFFGQVLRDTGQVAIIDGDKKELVTIVPTGFATHILRSSATGRYFMAIGRDGKASLIDLWMNPPQVVAESKPCIDARSIESSKFKGYEDKYAVVGCYWPPTMVILDGLTLEPIKMVSTMSYTKGAGEFVQEARVAAIVASQYNPEWIVNLKESGQTWLVDYSQLSKPGRPLPITMIDTERFLHDGGWALKRYFIVAANAVNKLIVIDTKTRQFLAEVEAGVRPHPGRGSNWEHPTYGPVWATGNIGSPEVTVVGVDPEKHPQYAWKVVQQIQLPYSGTLFIKTHPNSPWVIVDFPMSPSPLAAASLCAIDKRRLEVTKCWEVPGAQELKARMVHPEFNKGGTEIWVSA
jgi:nitrite reductase (NO-forming)/hydroxylamine reductase